MPTQIVFTGRLVIGHPMRVNERKDKFDKVLLKQDGTPRTHTFIAIAVPKIGSIVSWRPVVPGVPDGPWQQTDNWRQLFEKEAQEAWKAGEWQHPTFAWKIVDGDSMVPLKPHKGRPGRIPAKSEGHPGHWIVNCSTEWGVKCYHLGKYSPFEQIQNENEIKTGDYCRVLVTIKGNAPSETPGLYVNPDLFELSRPGIQIITNDGPDAAAAFGGSAPVLPANGAYDTGVAAPPPVAPAPAPPYVPPPVATTPVVPAPDFLNPPPPAPPAQYFINGTVFTEAQLLAGGWTPEQIARSPKYTG